MLVSSAILGSTRGAPLENLSEIATFTTSNPHGAEFYEGYLFIADDNSLLIYNTSDPERPKIATRFNDFGGSDRVLGLSISDEKLYVAAGPGWVYVLNISDPGNPREIYHYSYFSSANDVAVAGRYMYVADSNTGMLIFDLSDEANPLLVGKFYVQQSDVSGYIQGLGGIAVAASGNYAFLTGARRMGFYIIDVSDPSTPTEMFHTIGTKIVYDIAISDGGVYLAQADGTSQFDLLDVSNPHAPKIAGSFSMTGLADKSAIAIRPSGDYIYAASGNTWHVFRAPPPPQLMIESPDQGETSTNQTIIVSGTAFSESGVKEVLVNGKFAGTEVWNQTITLFEGANNIIITASDRYGNNITKIIQVTYSPPVPGIKTPAPTPTPIQTGIKAPVTYNPMLAVLIFVIFIAFVVIIYWVWMRKK